MCLSGLTGVVSRTLSVLLSIDSSRGKMLVAGGSQRSMEHPSMIPTRKNTARSPARDLLVPNPQLRLRDQVREVMRFKHYSVRTEEAYASSLTCLRLYNL